MTALSIQPTFPTFTGADGQPLENGYIWVGTANLNPITNPITVYWDAALSAPATQPIRTLGGYPSNSGTPARLYVNSDYSIQVLDRKGSVVYSAPVATDRYGGGIINANIVVYDPSGTGAVATTVQGKLRECVSVKDFGAVGDGVTDDTAAINAAILAVSTAGGGTVIVPAGIYAISSSIVMKSYVSLIGAYGESSLGDVINTKQGTEFKWIGAANSTMVSIVNTRLCKMDGFYLEGNGVTGLTGIKLDSTNTPSGSQVEIHRFSIRQCLIGVVWGTSGIAGGSYANDGIRFSTFTIWSTEALSRGFVINSGNAGQESVIESGGIQVQTTGIDIAVCNFLQIRRVFGGWKMATAFIQVQYAQGILIEGCSSEAWGAGSAVEWRHNDTYFLKVIAAAEGDSSVKSFTLTMMQNQINNPILIENECRILSIGDNWGSCRDSVTEADVSCTGTFTTEVSRCEAIHNGFFPATIDITTGPYSGMPAVGWIDSAFVRLSIVDPGIGNYVPAHNAANYTASAGTWTVTGPNVETFVWSLRNRIMTVTFKLNGTSLSTTPYVLKIKIPAGKIATNAVTGIALYSDSSVSNALAIATVGAGDTFIDFQPATLSAWLVGTNTLVGQITFEVN